MRLSLAQKLIKIANELDALGLYTEANSLTNMVKEAQTQDTLQQTQAPQQPQNQQQYPGGLQQAPVPAVQPPYGYTPQPYGYAQQNGWYNQPQIPLPPQNNVNPQQIQQQLLNMPASPFTAVRFGPDGKPIPQQQPQTMQEYVNNYIKSMQTQQSGANNTVQNARQMQIQQRRNELSAEDAQLAAEQYNQNLGDGHPKLYK